jgi:putative oxidoreductase
MELGLLILRLVAGLTLAAHGSQKLFGAFGGGGLRGTGAFFEQHLRFRPGVLFAFMAGLGEFGGGCLLALGFLTPAASAICIGVMGVAAWTAHRKNGFFSTAGGWEYNLALATMAAVPAFTGPGRFSVDHAAGIDWSGTTAGLLAVAVGVVSAAVVAGSAGRDRIEDPLEPPVEELADDTAVFGEEVAVDLTRTETPSQRVGDP